MHPHIQPLSWSCTRHTYAWCVWSTSSLPQAMHPHTAPALVAHQIHLRVVRVVH